MGKLDKFNEIFDHIGVPILVAVAGPYAGLIAGGIKIAELTGKNGKDKKAIAIEATRLAAEAVNIAKKAEVIRVDKAVATAESVIDVVIDTVNRISELENVRSGLASEDASKLFKPGTK